MRFNVFSKCLEFEPAQKLNDPRIKRRVDAAEVGGVDVEARARRTEGDVTDEEVRAVQNVEGFRPDLKSRRLRDAEVLNQAHTSQSMNHGLLRKLRSRFPIAPGAALKNTCPLKGVPPRPSDARPVPD